MSRDGVAVLRRDPERLCLMRVVTLAGNASGLALARDDTMLLVANGTGVAFLDVAKSQSGAQGAVLGSVSEAGSPGAIEVAATRDDRYAFVAKENYGTVGVIDLQRAGRGGAPSAALLAEIQVSRDRSAWTVGRLGWRSPQTVAAFTWRVVLIPKTGPRHTSATVILRARSRW